MPTDLNWKWFAGLIAAVALAVLVYMGYQSPSPNPVPSPSPAVSVTPIPSISATPSPSPTPSVTPTPSATPQAVKTSLLEKPTPTSQPVLYNSVSLKLWKGEETGFLVTSPNCLTISQPSEGVSLRLYEAIAVKTVKPTTLELPIGDHLDALVPKQSACTTWKWVDVSVSANALQPSYSFLIGDMPVSITVENRVMPVRPTAPFYMGLQPYGILLGHGLPNAGVQEQATLVKKYRDLLRSNRIEPFNAYLAQPPIVAGRLNLDNWSDLGGSFRQMVLDGAIATPMIMGFGDSYTQTYLQAVNATVLAEPSLANAWAYVIDEPAGTGLTTMTTRLNLLKANAPLLKRMVTTTPRTDIDYPTVNFDIYQPTMTSTHWIYGSCMSHASCANTVTAAKGTGTPDLMLDQPSIHARMYPIVAAGIGAKAMLYYTTNEAYTPAENKNPWLDQYMFGGNGDGQLVYPVKPGERGYTSHDVVGSIRLKMIRQGMFDLERLLANGKLGQLVTAPKVWSKLHSEIEAAR